MGHTNAEYRLGLEQIRTRILRMAGLVEHMIGSSTEALIFADAGVARSTIAMDATVDELAVEIDRLGVTTLARFRPMASDLRFVTMGFKMVTDLGRIGDLTVNICERAIDLADSKPGWRWDPIEEMAQLARTMVRDAIDAFLTADTERARAVIARDVTADAAYDRAFDDILESMMRGNGELHAGVHGLSVAKWLERIADHATNVAEQVVHVVEGVDLRHRGRGPARTGGRG